MALDRTKLAYVISYRLNKYFLWECVELVENINHFTGLTNFSIIFIVTTNWVHKYCFTMRLLIKLWHCDAETALDKLKETV